MTAADRPLFDLDRRTPPGPLWLASIGFWALVSLVGIAQGLGLPARDGSVPTFGVVTANVLVGTIPWALSMPVLVWYSARRPLERGTWHRPAAVILLLCLAWLVAAALIVSWPRAALGGRTWADQVALVFAQGKAQLLVEYSTLLLYATLGQAIAFADRARRRAVELREATEARAAMEHALTEARLANLRMRLQPHFLFNALNGVTTLIRRGDAKEAVGMLVGLADLMRLALRDDGPADHPLAEELELLDRYLAIEQLRYGPRLRVETDVPEVARARRVPALLLQPVVENAIRHGIATVPGDAAIRIGATVTDTALVLAIENDGPPLPDGFDLAAATGMGLALTARRLRLLGASDDALRLISLPGGVRVTLALPRSATDG